MLYMLKTHKEHLELFNKVTAAKSMGDLARVVGQEAFLQEKKQEVESLERHF